MLSDLRATFDESDLTLEGVVFFIVHPQSSMPSRVGT